VIQLPYAKDGDVLKITRDVLQLVDIVCAAGNRCGCGQQAEAHPHAHPPTHTASHLGRKLVLLQHGLQHGVAAGRAADAGGKGLAAAAHQQQLQRLIQQDV